MCVNIILMKYSHIHNNNNYTEHYTENTCKVAVGTLTNHAPKLHTAGQAYLNVLIAACCSVRLIDPAKY